MVSKKKFFPKVIGSAADFTFALENPIAYLIDCLTIYETILIPAHPFALSSIYSSCEPGQIDSLFEIGRIKYIPARSRGPKWNPDLGPYENVIRSLPDTYKDDDRFADLRSHIKKYFIMPKSHDYSKWLPIEQEATNAFSSLSMRKGYEWLMPRGPGGVTSHHRLAGLTSGLARINDLLVAGVDSFDLDGELSLYLKLCFPAQPINSVIESENSERIETEEFLRNLSQIIGVPPIGSMLKQGRISIKDAVEMINSEDSNKLREWLSENITPGIDLRDAYFSKLEKLPSKKEWVGWTRFGLVNGVSLAVGGLAGDPTIGAAASAAIGVIDNKYGKDLIEKTIDPYHPKTWTSYVKSKI